MMGVCDEPFLRVAASLLSNSDTRRVGDISRSMYIEDEFLTVLHSLKIITIHTNAERFVCIRSGIKTQSAGLPYKQRTLRMMIMSRAASIRPFLL